MSVHACPRCGGCQNREIAPGCFQCTTATLEGVTPPGMYGNPTHIPVHRPCGHVYAVRNVASGPCACGSYSIGKCADCGQPLCGAHATIGERFQCAGCIAKARQVVIQRAADERAAADAVRAGIATALSGCQDAREVRELLVTHKRSVTRMDCERAWLRIAHSGALVATDEIVTARTQVTFLEARKRGIPRSPGLWPEGQDSRSSAWMASGVGRMTRGTAYGGGEDIVDVWLDTEADTWRATEQGGSDFGNGGLKLIRIDQFRGPARTALGDSVRHIPYRHRLTDEQFIDAVTTVLRGASFRDDVRLPAVAPGSSLPAGVHDGGVYVGAGGYFRFYRGGQVMQSSMYEAHGPDRPPLNRDWGRVYEHDGRIVFAIRSNQGAVRYTGRVANDGDLVLSSLSLINGWARSEQHHRFEPASES